MQSYAQDQAVSSSLMPPPSRHSSSQSAPASKVGSPNVSPPNSYSPYISTPSSSLNASSRNSPHSSHSPHSSPMNINLLANAANKVESDSHYAHSTSTSHPSSRFANHIPPHHHHPYLASPNRLPGLSHYPLSHRSASNSRSRPESPNSSTAPSSPTFSHGSLSPTPDHTPLATPNHSPRLKPYGDHLPPLRHLTLIPSALAPLEPTGKASLDNSPYGSLGKGNGFAGGYGISGSLGKSNGYVNGHVGGVGGHTGGLHAAPMSTTGRIADILHRPMGEERKLPVPQQTSKVAVKELLNPVQ